MFLNKKKNVYFAFVDLEKAFDRVPRAVYWWAMRNLGVEEWLIRTAMSMFFFIIIFLRFSNTSFIFYIIGIRFGITNVLGMKELSKYVE